MTSPEGRLRCGQPSVPSLQSFLLRSIPTSMPPSLLLSHSLSVFLSCHHYLCPSFLVYLFPSFDLSFSLFHAIVSLVSPYRAVRVHFALDHPLGCSNLREKALNDANASFTEFVGDLCRVMPMENSLRSSDMLVARRERNHSRDIEVDF